MNLIKQELQILRNLVKKEWELLMTTKKWPKASNMKIMLGKIKELINDN